MDIPTPQRPDTLPQSYAAWRRRTIVAALVATAVGFATHPRMAEIQFDFGDERPSPGILFGLVSLVVGSLAPGLVGTGLALAALGTWRRLGRSTRLARSAWIVWVLGPLPVLLLPISHLFGLNAEDGLKTSVGQVRYLLTVTAPAFFALLPGALNAAQALERFLPESRAPGQITLVAAPACAMAYLLPLGILAQLAYHRELYLGLLLLAGSPLVPLAAVRRLLRRKTPEQAARLARTIGGTQGIVAILGVALLAGWVGEHPPLRAWLGQVDAVWVLGVAARVLASKWLTTVVVTDLLVAMLHQGRAAASALENTAEGAALGQKLDALGAALGQAGPATGTPSAAPKPKNDQNAARQDGMP